MPTMCFNTEVREKVRMIFVCVCVQREWFIDLFISASYYLVFHHPLAPYHTNHVASWENAILISAQRSRATKEIESKLIVNWNKNNKMF